MPNEKYTPDFFLDFFGRCPRKFWIVGTESKYTTIDGKEVVFHCAEGWVVNRLVQEKDEAVDELSRMLSPYADITDINDDTQNKMGFGEHPKTRIINALLRAKEANVG